MAISDEIQRLQSAKAALKTAINAKNDSSHQIDDETLEDYAGFVDEISTGGGTVQEAELNDVNFYDYDGKVLYSYTASEFQQLTEMPANPSHPGLTSQGWNYTLANAKTQVTNTGACNIGQMYITDDQKTRLYCYFGDGRLSPCLGLCPNGSVVVDWGDNSATETMTGTSTVTVVTLTHTYAAPGYYVITLDVTGNCSITGVSNTSYLLRKDDTQTAYVHRPYTMALYKMELGKNFILNGSYCFNYCGNLETITIPSNMTSWATYAFQYCYSIRHVNFAHGTTLKNYLFRYAYGLRSVSIPFSATSVPQACFTSCQALLQVNVPYNAGITSSAFQNNYSLHRINVPTNLTKLNSGVFQNGYALTRLDFPSTLTEIDSNALSSCYGLAELHFASTTPPTINATSALSNLPSDCIIYVPSASLTTYQTATNWSTYASQIVGE